MSKKPQFSVLLRLGAPCNAVSPTLIGRLESWVPPSSSTWLLMSTRLRAWALTTDAHRIKISSQYLEWGFALLQHGQQEELYDPWLWDGWVLCFLVTSRCWGWHEELVAGGLCFLVLKYKQHNIDHPSPFATYSSVAWSTFTLLCNHDQHSTPELFSSWKMETLYPLNNNSPFPPSPSPGQPPFYSLSLWIWLV